MAQLLRKTNPAEQIWQRFSERPDLERSLTKTAVTHHFVLCFSTRVYSAEFCRILRREELERDDFEQELWELQFIS